MRTIFSGMVSLSLLFALACGGGNGVNSNNNSGSGLVGVEAALLAGSYEFTGKSTIAPTATRFTEANLSAKGSQLSASGPSQVQAAAFFNQIWYVNGGCTTYPSPGQNSITGTISGNEVILTFNEGGIEYAAQGVISGQTITGTYVGSNPQCQDSGTFTATLAHPPAGSFSGTLNVLSGPDQVSATITQGSDHAVTLQVSVSGADNGTFRLSGSQVGNVMLVAGSLNGTPISWFGYYDAAGLYTGTANSIAVIDYEIVCNFDNVTNDGLCPLIGVLVNK